MLDQPPMGDTPLIETERLRLTPLQVADAVEMVVVLDDRDLYEFTGGEPADLDQLIARYGTQVIGPARPDEAWHNWIVRLAESHAAIGYVQTTVTGNEADVAWVIGTRAQGRGFAREAATAMCAWLEHHGIRRITAHIHPNHVASAAVAEACGLRPTDEIDDDGEVVWESARR